MKVGVLFPSGFAEPGEFLADARAMEAARVDSIWLEDAEDGIDPLLALAAIAAVTTEVRLGLITDKPIDARRMQTLASLSRGRVVPGSERWQRAEAPADREEWAVMRQRAWDGAEGILLPMNPRLLDILRHPDDAVDRSDLVLAQG